jgi:hypothetical protein
MASMSEVWSFAMAVHHLFGTAACATALVPSHSKQMTNIILLIFINELEFVFNVFSLHMAGTPSEAGDVSLPARIVHVKHEY